MHRANNYVSMQIYMEKLFARLFTKKKYKELKRLLWDKMYSGPFTSNFSEWCSSFCMKGARN